MASKALKSQALAFVNGEIPATDVQWAEVCYAAVESEDAHLFIKCAQLLARAGTNVDTPVLKCGKTALMLAGG